MISNLDKTKLRKFIVNHYNTEEMEILCSDIEQNLLSDNIALMVNLDAVGGNTLEGKALNLITYLEKRGCLNYLVNHVKSEYPDLVEKIMKQDG